MAASQLPPVLTASQVAEYLGISPRELYILVTAGRIPAFKEGNEWRFDRAAIDRWAEMLET